MFSPRFRRDNSRCVASRLCFDKNFIAAIHFIDSSRTINLINTSGCYRTVPNLLTPFNCFRLFGKGDALLWAASFITALLFV